jgi:phosphohistidine phosphatase SixA
MRTVLVTHAEASEFSPRLLTPAGALSAGALAGRIAEIMGTAWRARKVVSSPAVRCIQTALTILPVLADEKLRRLDTDPRLMAARDPMGPGQLFGALADYPCEGLLVVLHADLATALSDICRPLGESGGWFTLRPVICILDWDNDRPPADNRVILLEGPQGEPLLPPGPGGAPNGPILLT